MRFSFLILFVFVSTFAVAQHPGYKIDFKIAGWKDTTAYLGNYYGESTYLRDTARVNSQGEFSFDGKKALDRGVYFLVLNKMKIFEFVIGNTQEFKMETNADDYVKNMKVTGDVDNKIFFENWNYKGERQKEADPYIKVIQDSTLKDDQKKDARNAMSKITDKVMAYEQDLIDRYPNTITALIFKSNQTVKVPDAPKKPNGTIDSTFQLRWYREHYFDNFNLADDALLRMPKPIYAEKINEYLDRLYAPQPDSLTKAIFKLVDKAKPNQETYKFAVFTIMRKFQEPEIMGLDAVYVNVYDKYVATGEMDFWMNANHKKNVKEYVDRLRKSLIGKQGPNLIMQDVNLKPKSMYDIKAKYTILYIYDPDCGHCRKETPKLVEFYAKNKTRFNLEVFAVSIDTSMAKMKDYIKEMKMNWINVNGPRTYLGPYKDSYDAITTPSLFILDDHKIIIGKKIASENLENFFINYEKFVKKHPTDKIIGDKTVPKKL